MNAARRRGHVPPPSPIVARVVTVICTSVGVPPKAAWTRVVLSLVSGFLIFTGGALTYFEGQWFRRKMTLLLIALVFNFTWFRIVASAADGRFGPWTQRLTAALALLLWFAVGVSGRAIAFF